MRDFKTVFFFELNNKLKQKSVKVTTIIILAILFLVTFIPTFTKMSSESDTTPGDVTIIEEPVEGDTNEYGYVVLNQSIEETKLKTIYPFNNAVVYNEEETLKEAIKNKEIEKGIVLSSPTSFKLIANDLSLYDMSEQEVSASLQLYNRNEFLAAEGIDPQKVDQSMNFQITSATETMGKSAFAGFFFAYVGMFAVYFIIILYGNSVSTSVAREKNDRTMELLITNTSSNNLIVGKVMAATVLSSLQLILMVIILVLGYSINSANYPAELVSIISNGITFDALVVFLVFAIFGTLLYYFLFAAVGALVSKVEEVNSAMTPIQFIFIGAFSLCAMGMNMPDSTMMKVISIVPFSSPMAMFVRYSLTTIPLVEVITSIILLIATTIFMAYIAIKIYRMGTLNYGNRVGFFKAVGMVFKKQ